MSELALELIKANKKTKSPILDLGRCGMTEVPEAVGELVWLEELILSDEWYEYEYENKSWVTKISQNKGGANQIEILPSTLPKLLLLQKLVLSSTQVSDLKPIAGLTGLQILFCYSTKVSDLTPIAALTSLQILDCNSSLVSDLTPIAALTSLQILDSASTQVSDLTPIAALTSLQQLHCDSTQVSDLTPIAALTSLQILYCQNTQVSDLTPIAALTNLQILYCQNTQVSDLTPIATLTSLQQLHCSSTQVSDLTPIAALTSLQQLHCSSTQVSDLTPIAALTSLQILYCFGTQVSDLTPIAALTSLQILNCNSTKVSDLSPIVHIIKSGLEVKWRADSWRGNGIYLGDCPLTNPPVEIVKQGNEAILRYFDQIEAQDGTERLFEAKLIIVGEGQTGKTTLFEKMKDESHDPVKTPTGETHGINILEGLPLRHASLGGRHVAANLWDFGGQDLQYMTHQFFLTPRALYVLMINARSESPNLAYWFKIISLLGKESEDSNEKVPLLLVFNKRLGGTGKTPEWQGVLKYYENHLAPTYIEADLALNEGHFHHVRGRLEEMAAALPIIQAKVPKKWVTIREALREEAKKKPYITAERLAEICEPFGVTDWHHQFQMTNYLHQLGALLHFQNDEKLMNTIILQPKWAVEGVYTFLKNEQLAKQFGHFSSDAFLNTLCEQGYTRTGGQKILQMMTKDNFDICYEATKGQYVATQLLPDNPPDYTFHKNDCLQFRYQYPIMPKGLLSRLIVRLSEYLERDSERNEQIVWKKGAVLLIPYNGQNCRVRIMEDDAESSSGLREIIIEVLGEPAYRKYGLQRVRQEVSDLHRLWFRSIHAHEMVPCCCDQHCKKSTNPYLHKLDKLLNLKFNRRIKEAQCGESGEPIPIDLMLEGVYDREEVRKFERETLGERERHGTGVDTYNH